MGRRPVTRARFRLRWKLRRACAQDDILMFGGSGGRESRPQYVQNEWSVATEFMKAASPALVRACTYLG